MIIEKLSLQDSVHTEYHAVAGHDVEVQDLAQLDYEETVIFQNVHNFCAQSTVLSPPQDVEDLRDLLTTSQYRVPI